MKIKKFNSLVMPPCGFRYVVSGVLQSLSVSVKNKSGAFFAELGFAKIETLFQKGSGIPVLKEMGPLFCRYNICSTGAVP